MTLKLFMEVLESLLLTVVGCLHRDTEAIVLGTAHFSANDRDKFTKINSAIAIFVEFADKLVEFGIIKVDMPKGPATMVAKTQACVVLTRLHLYDEISKKLLLSWSVR